MSESAWRELIIDGFGRLPEIVKEAIGGFSPADLERQPPVFRRRGKEGRLNSLGWTVWHLIRVEDGEMANLMGEDQLWITEGWHKKFKRPADSEDTGFEHTEEQVKAFRSPSIQTYLDYLNAVTERTKKYLSSLDLSELGRELNEPWFTPLPKVGVRIMSILADCHQHAGEASYIRGWLTHNR